MNETFYKKLMEHSPEGYAYHQIITDGEGKPVDYIFLDANQSFERATGLSKGKIIGKKVTKVLPGIENSNFDWIGIYGKVALTGESTSFKQYSEQLGRWYNVIAYSNERGYFVTVFHDITSDAEEKEALEILANSAHEAFEQAIGKLDYEKFTDNILQMSGAKFAAINTYNKEGTKTVTRAISGVPESIRKASEIMGLELTGRAWDIIPERAKSIRGGCLLRFDNLYEASFGSISKQLSFLLEKTFGLGEVYVAEMTSQGEPIGDFILFMPSGKIVKNSRIVEIYARQVGLLVERKRNEDKLKKAYEQYQSLADNIPGIAYLCMPDKKWTMLFMSNEAYFITGYPSDDFIGNKVRTYESVIHREDTAFVTTSIEGAVAAGKTWEVKYRVCHKDGDIRWVHEKGRGVKSEDGKIAFLEGIIIDITQQKKADEALRESEALNRSIVNTIPDIIFKISISGEYLDVIIPDNHQLLLPKEELLGKKAADILPEEIAGIIIHAIEEAFLTNTLQTCEYSLTVPAGSMYFEARIVPADEITAYALIRDITDRKKAEDAFIESKRQLDLFFSQSLSGFFFMMLDEPVAWNESSDKEVLLDYVMANHRITKVNQAMLDQYGAKEEDFIGMTPKDFFAHDIEYGRFIFRSLFNNGRWHVETKEQKLDGTPITIDGDYICLFDDQGRITGHFGVQSDVTAQKQAQQTIIESEERFRQISENISEVFWLRNADNTRMIYVNPAYEKVWGRTCQSLYDNQNSFIDSVYDADKPAVFAELEKYMNNGGFDLEYRIVRPDGGIRWVRAQSFPVKNSDNQVVRHTGIAVDITERKQAENKLRESEANFRTFFESIDDMIVVGTEQGVIFYTNGAVSRKLGYTQEELQGMHILDMYPKEKRDEAERIFGDMFAGRRSSCPLPLAKKDGTFVPVDTRVWFGKWDGRDCVFGVSKDLSIQQAALDKFHKLFDNNPALMAVNSMQDKKFVEVNNAFLDKLGFSREEIIGKTAGELGLFVDNDMQLEVAQVLRNEARIKDIELTVRNKEGQIMYGLFSGEIIDNQLEKAFLTIMTDITERKKAEEKLRESELNQRILLDNIETQVWYLTNETTYGAINKAHAEFNGVQIQDLAYRNLYDIFPKEIAEVCKQSNTEVFTTGKAVHTEEWVPHASGEKRLVSITKSPKLRPDGSVEYVVCSAEDITFRKQMEEQLYKEKEQFRTTLLSVGDGVISTDVQGNVVIMNKISEQLTGWKQEESVGKPIEEVFNIINEFTRERRENPVHKVLETGDIIELANHTLLIAKDGTERPIEDSAAPIKNEHGNITGVVLVFRDFTEKKKIQDEIEYLSFHDHLTGCYNRRFYEAERKRLDTKRNLPLTIVMGDVNGLKMINDSFGHDTGDQLLIKAAEALKNGCRADDIIARVGGDEFVILLPKTDGFKTQELINRIKGLLKKDRVADLEISISFGYETKTCEAEEIESIYKKAEDRMYKNKLFEGPSIRGRVIDDIMPMMP